MNRICQFLLWLGVTAFFCARAQTVLEVPVAATSAATNNLSSSTPQMQSPVVFFRKLLAMSPDEREAALKNRPPEARERILQKVTEYQMLPSELRDLRLRATELRWWLTPMLRMSLVDQKKRLAQMPEDLRGLAESRLEQWKLLPTPIREEFLTNDQALHYFALVPSDDHPAATAQQKKVAEQFNRFFELTAEEKEQSLNKLPEEEREQMAETLKTFDNLSPQHRQICLRNYTIFASMSTRQREEFLKNAELWSKMTPEERQSWRELVAQVPIWPQGWIPPGQTPPPVPGSPHPGMATNAN
jgi:hypothetical protein